MHAGIITEKGCIPKAGSSFGIRQFFEEHGLALPDAPVTSEAMKPLDDASVVEYVAAQEDLAKRVDEQGGAGKAAWECKEIGDGNINFVFVITGPSGSIIVKQGLPYIRCVGESWPLSQVWCCLPGIAAIRYH